MAQLLLELEVDMPSEAEGAELQERLDRQIGRLRQILDEAVPVVPFRDEERSSGKTPLHARARSAEPAPARVREPACLAHLNHPTTPVGPSFLLDGSHWSQRRKDWLLKQERERLRRQQQEDAKPFKASPVPSSVLVPRFHTMQAAEAARRGRLAERGNESVARDSRPSSAERACLGPLPASVEELPAPFRARPVPWCVSAPMYEQLQLQEQQLREERRHARSQSLLRSSSLPPRLEAARRKSAEDAARACAPAPPSQPKRLAQECLHGIRSNTICSAMAAAENLAQDLSAYAAARKASAVAKSKPATDGQGISRPSRGPSPARVARGRTPPPQRHAELADPWAAQPLGTTEVPDFAALHERERQRLERRKYQNRLLTQPAPFTFHAPARSRQPSLAKDPTADWRWKRASSARPASAGATMRGSEDRGGHCPGAAPKRPSVVVPSRTTEKTLQWQQHNASALQERREQEWQRQQQLQQAHEVSSAMRLRVQQAVGPVEPLEEKIQKIASDKRQGGKRMSLRQHRDLRRIKERVSRRPLLMEQADSLVRARRRALFRVRSALESAGVRNVDRHFQDEELDELDRAEATEDAANFY